MKKEQDWSQEAIDQGLVPMSQENAIVDGPDDGPQRRVGDVEGTNGALATTPNEGKATDDEPEREKYVPDGVPRNYKRFGAYAFAVRMNANKLKEPGPVLLMLTKDRRVFKQVKLKSERAGWSTVGIMKDDETHEQWCYNHWRRGSAITKAKETKT